MINIFVNARKWPEFINRFGVPQDWPNMERRVMTNIQYYWQNYAILSLVLSCVMNITSFRTLIFILGMVTAWIYVLFVIRPVPKLKKSDLMQPPGEYSDIVARIATLPFEQRALGLVVVSLCVALSFGIFFRIVASLLLSVCVCTLHAILRPENMKAKALKIQKNVKGIFGKILSPPQGYDKDTGVAVSGSGSSLSHEDAQASASSGVSASAYAEESYHDIESMVGARENTSGGEFRQRSTGRPGADAVAFATPSGSIPAVQGVAPIAPPFGGHPTAPVDNLPRPGKSHVH